MPVKSKKKPVKKNPNVECQSCKRKDLPRKFAFVTNTKHTVCGNCTYRYADYKRLVPDRTTPNGVPTPGRTRQKAPKEDTDLPELRWYVLEVEPGQDYRVKKDITRKVKIESMQKLVKRVIVPGRLQEVVRNLKGEVVHEEKADSQHTCHLRAQKKCRELAGVPDGEKGPDGAGATPGYRYVIFRGKGREKGRESNEWTWQVKTVPPGKECKTMRLPRYPGYLILQLSYTPKVADLLRKARGAWGLLMQPVVKDLKVQVTKSAVPGRWNWKVRHPETKEILARGKVRGSRERAESEAKAVKDDMEAFKPTALKSKEAAEEVIHNRALNQIMRDKTIRDTPALAFRKGSTVKVVGGAFRDCKGVVTNIDSSDKTRPQVTIKTEVMGVEIPVTLNHYELECLKR